MEDKLSQFHLTEYQALRDQERCLMERTDATWTHMIAIVAGFAIALRPEALWLWLVVPILLMYLAKRMKHSLAVLKMIRKYLLQSEPEGGYEHFVRSFPRPSHGTHVDAIQWGFLTTGLLAVSMGTWHLWSMGLWWLALVAVVAETIVMYMTFRMLSKSGKGSRSHE